MRPRYICLELRHDVDAEFLSQPFQADHNYVALTRKHDEGMVIRSGPNYCVLIVKWSGHDRISTLHSCPNDDTTRTFPTNACVNAVWAISVFPCKASTGSSDIGEISEPEYMNTLT